MTIGIDLQLLQESEKASSTSAYATNLVSKLQKIQDIVKQNMIESGQRAKKSYDVDTQTPQILVGFKVLLHSDVIKPGQCAKFHKPWTGPYLVTNKTDDGLLYTLRHCSTGKPIRSAVHANRLKLFDDDRDTLYNRHNITPKRVTQVTPPVSDTAPTNTADTSDDVWYAVDRLLDHRKSGGKILYLVKWQDQSRSWEPSENITDFAINEYNIRKQQIQDRRKKRRR